MKFHGSEDKAIDVGPTRTGGSGFATECVQVDSLESGFRSVVTNCRQSGATRVMVVVQGDQRLAKNFVEVVVSELADSPIRKLALVRDDAIIHFLSSGINLRLMKSGCRVRAFQTQEEAAAWLSEAAQPP